jgi:hypothetical protein
MLAQGVGKHAKTRGHYAVIVGKKDFHGAVL